MVNGTNHLGDTKNDDKEPKTNTIVIVSEGDDSTGKGQYSIKLFGINSPKKI